MKAQGDGDGRWPVTERIQSDGMVVIHAEPYGLVADVWPFALREVHARTRSEAQLLMAEAWTRYEGIAALELALGALSKWYGVSDLNRAVQVESRRSGRPIATGTMHLRDITDWLVWSVQVFSGIVNTEVMRHEKKQAGAGPKADGAD